MRGSVRVTVEAIFIAAISMLLRAGPLGPGTLWLDDAWAAAVVKADSWGELWLTGATAPGFAWILKAWFLATGFSEITAQLLPFIIGSITPSLLYILMLRRGVGRPAALMVAALIAFAPLHLTYSTRVKQFTLDALATLGVLWTGWAIVELPDERTRWWAFLGIGILATLISSSAVVVVAGVFLALFTLMNKRRIKLIFTTATIYGFVSISWWILVLRPRINEGLRAFWQGQMIYLDEGLREVLVSLAHSFEGLLSGFSILHPTLLMLALVANWSILLYRKPRLALVIILPIFVALGAAVLQIAPFGGGRTDIYLYPLLAASLVLNFELPFKQRPALALTGVIVTLLLIFRPLPHPYPNEPLKSLVVELESQIEPEHALLIYGHTSFAFGIYTSFEVDIVKEAVFDTGFAFKVKRPNVHYISREIGVLKPVEAVRNIDGVWFLASHPRGEIALIETTLLNNGFTQEGVIRDGGSSLAFWKRSG